MFAPPLPTEHRKGAWGLYDPMPIGDFKQFSLPSFDVPMPDVSVGEIASQEPSMLKHSERGLPICKECGEEYRFDLNAPLADCACGTAEWGHGQGGDKYREIERQLRLDNFTGKRKVFANARLRTEGDELRLRLWGWRSPTVMLGDFRAHTRIDLQIRIARAADYQPSIEEFCKQIGEQVGNYLTGIFLTGAEEER